MNENTIIEILLVEDSLEDVEMTLRALKKAGLGNHIHVVRDGEEALEFLFCEGAYVGRNIHDSPKVVLLDLKLPKVDGLEVLARVKGDERTKKIPMVMLTSSKEQTDIIKSYDIGVNSYIVKPVDFEQFVKAVQGLGMYWVLLNQPPKLEN